MSQVLSVTQLLHNFADYLNRVAYRGESFVLTRGRKPVAELGPVAVSRYLSELPEIVRSLPRLSPEEAEGFAEDLAALQGRLREAGAPQDPWVS